MNILRQIVANKREEIAQRKQDESIQAVRTNALAHPVRPSFFDALRGVPIGLIAEVKRRSPSAGSIREPFDPADIARGYESAGAQAISCLMDEKYFGGGESDFRTVRSAVKLPMLYKEFVVDAWQVWHAVSLGSSLLLLIVAALERAELESLMTCCREAGIDPLVEVHGEDELDAALDAGARIIGVNNRNLKTFEVNLETSFRLRESVPDDHVFVSESGIRSSEDVLRLQQAGVDAVLVGEQLLRQPDVSLAVKELMGAAWASS
ncbi:MAG: indole-3-glycerol phosphate synthase TrpC [Verrucomicrobia bacterium]|nr:indole-3-glycerol phosphate synthase TrpC [Verrucomicrobiota bacterium]